MCDWRKLPRRVTSRPEIEIADQRLAFSYQTPSIEPSYKTVPKQLKIKISRKAQGFLKKFRVQHVALTVRRPKHPCLVWCTPIFLYETFSRLVPRDPNKGHHSRYIPKLSNRLTDLPRGTPIYRFTGMTQHDLILLLYLTKLQLYMLISVYKPISSRENNDKLY